MPTSLHLFLLSAFVVTVLSECSPYCLDCQNDLCYECMNHYQLADQTCHKIPIGVGPVIGIVIGSLVGGAILVFALLCIVVWCSETVEEKAEILEQSQARVNYLPQTHQHLNLPESNLVVNNQVVQAYVNSYPQTQQIPDLPQIKRMGPQQIQTLNSRTSFIPIDNCALCNRPGTNLQLTPCGHNFHVPCLTTFPNKTNSCPACMSLPLKQSFSVSFR